MAWARQEGQEIKIYSRLPHGWQSGNGYWNDFRTQPDAIHRQEGFYPIHNPSYDARYQELGDLEFDAPNNRFTYPVSNKSLTLDEAKDLRKDEVYEYIEDMKRAFDTYFARLEHTKTAVPSRVQDEIDNFYAEVAKWESAIDGAATLKAVKQLTFDRSTSQAVKEKLAKFR